MNNVIGNVIEKIDSFIVEIQSCQENNQFEELKLRIRTYLQGIYGSHPYSNNTCLNKEYENVDRYGKQAVSTFFTEKTPNRRLTKNINPIINHLREVREVISKDGLPQDVNPSMIINVNDSRNTSIAAYNTGNTTQNCSFSMSDFNNHYPQAIKEIEQTTTITDEQKKELLAMLEMFKDSLEKDGAPHSYVINKLKEFSLKAISIGADTATIFSLFIQPHLDAISK